MTLHIEPSFQTEIENNFKTIQANRILLLFKILYALWNLKLIILTATQGERSYAFNSQAQK